MGEIQAKPGSYKVRRSPKFDKEPQVLSNIQIDCSAGVTQSYTATHLKELVKPQDSNKYDKEY